MRGINKVTIMGVVGAAPEVKSYGDNKVATRISVATNEKWVDKETAEKKEKVSWHSIMFFRQLAEVAAQYLKVGTKIYLEGKLDYGRYIDKEGIERFVTRILADSLQIIADGNWSSKDGGEQQQAAPAQQQQNQPAQQASYKPYGHNKKTAPAPASKKSSLDDFFDDDIPF
jgi:single-strand DNA-binding protein